MVATGILSVAVVSLADLLAMATRANVGSRNITRAVILAEQKMEQLKSLTWELDDSGRPRSDLDSNLAEFDATGACAGVATGAGIGLTPSPPGALAGNVDGYVDYVDAQGCGLGGGAVPPPSSTYVRRWSIEVSDTAPDTLVLQVLVTDRGIRTATPYGSGVPGPEEARLVGIKTRRTP